MGSVLLYFASVLALLWIVHRTTTPLSRGAAIVLIALPLLVTGRALFTGGVYGPIDLAYDVEPLASVAADHGMTGAANPMLTDVQRLMIPWRAAVRYAFAHGQWPLWNPFSFSGDILAAASEPSPWHPFNLLSYLLPLAQSVTFHASMVLFAASLGAFLFARDLGASEEGAFVAAAGWMLSQFILFYVQVPLGAAVAMQPLVLVCVRRIVADPAWSSIVRLAVVLALVVVAGHPESTLHVVTLGVAWGIFEIVVARRPVAIAAAASSGVLALLLSAIHLLPFLEALPQTADYQHRVTRFAAEARWVGAGEASERLLRAVVPFVFGSPASEAAGVPPHYLHPSWPYAGSISLVLGVIGLIAWRDRARWFLGALALFGFLAGVSAPGISHVLARLPLFDIALNERLVFAAVLAVVTLAAFGSDRLRDVPRALPLIFAITLTVAVVALWPKMTSSGLTERFLRANAARELIPLFAFAAVALLRPAPRTSAAAVAGLLLMQRLLEDGRMTPTYPASAFYPRTPVVDALPRTDEPYRVVATGSILTPNTSAHYEIEDPRGFHGMVFAPLAEVIPLWSKPVPVSHNEVDDLRKPLLRFLNVRFAIVRANDEVPPPWETRLVWRGARLVENPGWLPRAFLPASVGPLPSPDFVSRAAIEGTADRPNGTGRVATQREGTDLLIDAALDSRAWIVVSETAWKGWTATIDGEAAPLRRANGAFLAIDVPPGRHRIRLRYKPVSFVAGAAMTIVTIAVLAVVPPIVRRRKGRS